MQDFQNGTTFKSSFHASMLLHKRQR